MARVRTLMTRSTPRQFPALLKEHARVPLDRAFSIRCLTLLDSQFTIHYMAAR
jgi:hypothetical protein